MNVNQKGAYGLIEVIRDLTRKGFECFTPFDDHGPVDLIAMNTETYKTYKLQVKYRSVYRGTVEVQFRTVSMGKHSDIDFDAIDGWACYNPDLDKVVYISKDDIDYNKKSIHFRIEPVNKGKSPHKMHDDFKHLKEWA
jgi:hypothetical protein